MSSKYDSLMVYNSNPYCAIMYKGNIILYSRIEDAEYVIRLTSRLNKKVKNASNTQ